MNEEITRILQMLEDGKIGADEVEKLIRALRESQAAPPPPPPPPPPKPQPSFGEAAEDWWGFCANPFRDLEDLGRILRQTGRQIRRNRIRRYWWHHYRLNHWCEMRRRRRKETMTTFERVRFVLLLAPVENDFIVQPDTNFHDLLRRDRIAWDNFRYGLQEEFRLDISLDRLDSLRTVQDVVDFVEAEKKAKSAPQAETAETWPPTEPDTPAEPEVPAEPAEPAVPSPASPEAPKPSRRKSEKDVPPVEDAD
jgi:hypothetical protein